uniref:Uncharacterized protein n=1 Tax=Kwoniella dejecticola CBS 10117 TaxID=1296121 RepID=A0A1A5ZUC5_9TREE|nr:uncharacterized protein I303_08178 [Kwoniella dejecticola CBS 10117]OBR81408.1 hypothetical protein I303_08178 [Kwoniella dejecticola CBS 10117]
MSPIPQVPKPPTPPDDDDGTTPTSSPESEGPLLPMQDIRARLDQQDILEITMPSTMGSARVQVYGEAFDELPFFRIMPPFHETIVGSTPGFNNNPNRLDPTMTIRNGLITPIGSGANTPSSGNTRSPHFHSVRNYDRTFSLMDWKIMGKGSGNFAPDDTDHSKSNICQVTEHIHSGVTWDSIREDIPPPEERQSWDYDFVRDRTRVEVIGEVINQDYMLRQHLRHLQGSVVPYYYGMFIWRAAEDDDEDDWTIASVMEDVGAPVYPVMELYPLAVNESRHILEREHKAKRNPKDGRFALVDFSSAISVADWQAADKKTMIDGEVRDMEYSLGVSHLHGPNTGKLLERT